MLGVGAQSLFVVVVARRLQIIGRGNLQTSSTLSVYVLRAQGFDIVLSKLDLCQPNPMSCLSSVLDMTRQ